MEPTPPGKAFSMGVRPAACSTGDVCMALDYLEDPAAHGITTQVCCEAILPGSPCVSLSAASGSVFLLPQGCLTGRVQQACA